MLRPIDIQSQFSQSPALSNKQQIVNQQITQQQEQLTDLMKKELVHNQEVIVQINQGEKVDNRNKQNRNIYDEQKKKKSKSKDGQEQAKATANQIDIRL